ncbi:hypothetical protein MAXJ12_27473, partial [Mesorhizobium alhagi CCNWXJ12-2]
MHLYQLPNMIGQSQRRRQAWRFNPEQMDQARNAVTVAAFNGKILSWRSGRHDFRTNSRVAWEQPRILETRPVAPDSAGKARQA